MYFPNKRLYETHQDVHKSVRDVTCPECGKTFASKRYLQTHTMAMHRDKKYECELCRKKYAFKTELKNHMQFIHLKRKRPGYCSSCKLKFSTQSEMSAHRKQCHPDEETYKCCYCTKAFARRYRYRSHLKVTHKVTSEILEDGSLAIHTGNHGNDEKVAEVTNSPGCVEVEMEVEVESEDTPAIENQVT